MRKHVKQAVTEQQQQEEQVEIGRLPKNNSSETVVRINKFKGKTYVDIRNFTKSNGNLYPTTKGISIHYKSLSPMLDLLEKAEEELNKQTPEA